MTTRRNSVREAACVPMLSLIVFLAGVFLTPTGASDFPAWIARADAAVSSDKAERGPAYPWPSFVVFWNKRCKPGCEIQNATYQNSRYLVPYGYSVSLVVEMQNDYVVSVRAVYGDPAVREGGQRWIKLVESVITVGTFRWPDDRIDEVKQRFRAISPEPATYMWQNSSFKREQTAGGWEFVLRFLPQAVY